MFCWPSDFEVIPKKSNIFEVCGGNSRNGPMTVASVIALHNFEGCNPYQSHPRMRFQHVPLWVVLTKCSTLKNMTVLVTLVSDGAKITWLLVSNVYKHRGHGLLITSLFLLECGGSFLDDICITYNSLSELQGQNPERRAGLRRVSRHWPVGFSYGFKWITALPPKKEPTLLHKISTKSLHSQGLLVTFSQSTRSIGITWTWKTRKSIKIPNMSWFSWNWQTPTNSATSMSWFRLICLIE